MDLAGEDMVPSLQEVGWAMDLDGVIEQWWDLKFTPLGLGQRTCDSVLGASLLIPVFRVKAVILHPLSLA